MNIESILNEREISHGKWESNSRNVAELWSAYLGFTVHPDDVASMMILFKIARTMDTGGSLDTWDDICGYAALAKKQRQEIEVNRESFWGNPFTRHDVGCTCNFCSRGSIGDTNKVH
jgi:hypothetical protein